MNEKDDAASRPDDDNPEWTREEIRTARPALEAIGEIFGADAAEAIRRRDAPERTLGALAGSRR